MTQEADLRRSAPAREHPVEGGLFLAAVGPVDGGLLAVPRGQLLVGLHVAASG